MSLIDLSGRVALVTGGSRGIGAATARLFARAGADVAFTYRERLREAEAVREAVEAAGRRPMAIELDVADPSAHEHAVSETIDRLGRLDHYVANAGTWPADDVALRDLSVERWRRTLDVNLDGVFYGCRAALPRLGPGATIVIVSSTAGQRGEAFHADYAASKGAVIALVKSLAVEAAPAVTVNAVAPGWVDTEMADQPYRASGGRGREEIESAIPLRRIATPEDIAGPIVFLCSPLARHITGEIVNVNGGAVLCG